VDNLTLTFSSSNYDTAQTITAIAQNDTVDDGDISYTVFLMPAQSSDSRYNGLNPQDLGFVNVDNDSSTSFGFIISAPTNNASVQESGTTSSEFTVKLASEPSATVTIDYYSTDTTEGVVVGSQFNFDSSTWNTVQTVTVTAVNESDNDSDQYFQVILLPAISSDNNYNGLDPQDLGFVNKDDD
jgi:CCR4-NOT transcriptional regulation complex NOT5 subunit